MMIYIYIYIDYECTSDVYNDVYNDTPVIVRNQPVTCQTKYHSPIDIKNKGIIWQCHNVRISHSGYMRVIGISLEGDEGAVGSAFSIESGIKVSWDMEPVLIDIVEGHTSHDDNNTVMELLATHYDVLLHVFLQTCCCYHLHYMLACCYSTLTEPCVCPSIFFKWTPACSISASACGV